MKANPVLKKLGLADNDRVVIFHADDIGMFQASVSAYADLVDFGLLTSAGVMVPCPWFSHVSEYCRRNQGNKKVDMGVHLTITSEWKAYRWGPISTCDSDSGLMDDTGYFFDNCEDVQKNGDVDSVRDEIRTQVERALVAGIDITHIDSHMGALFHPKFVDAYLEVAWEYKLPALFLRQDGTGLRQLGIDSETAKCLTQRVSSLEAKG
ncbi:MAG: ChbG/HpnK family deacetylase, partial [Anaerolineales bacterium]|nr:ChbG/HpnK family deacetylase [Anaerolineales bacterium]